MRILFNLLATGLGNQGGSLTIVNCANTLVKLGHEVIIIDSGRNQHTWTPLIAEHRRIKDVNKIPEADAIIATGYKSVYSTIKAPIKCGKKFHYIRGWETWKFSESDIVKRILKAPTTKIVNSLCLFNKLNQYDTESIICRPGYDLDLFYPIKAYKPDEVILGALMPPSKHFNNKRGDWIANAYKILKKKYNIKLYMFGSESPRFKVDEYIKQPDSETKNVIYNKIDIWLSTSHLEGLHMPPAEAMLTECPVVGTDAEMSGTQDYLIHNVTGLVAENKFESFVKHIGVLIENRSLRKKLKKAARNKILELGDRQINMERFVKILQGDL